MPCQFAGGHLRHRRHRKKLENKELRHTWRNQRVAGSVHKQKQSPSKNSGRWCPGEVAVTRDGQPRTLLAATLIMIISLERTQKLKLHRASVYQ
jgi:hypothetical protein